MLVLLPCPHGNQASGLHPLLSLNWTSKARVGARVFCEGLFLLGGICECRGHLCYCGVWWESR